VQQESERWLTKIGIQKGEMVTTMAPVSLITAPIRLNFIASTFFPLEPESEVLKESLLNYARRGYSIDKQLEYLREDFGYFIECVRPPVILNKSLI
jgi:hypothetical protein